MKPAFHHVGSVFINNLNVLFLSNSQPKPYTHLKRLEVFINNLNVLFLSNSQLTSSATILLVGVYQ